MDVLRKMTASRICRSNFAGVEEISHIMTDVRISQIKEDPIKLTAHLKSQPVHWKHISENLEMTVAAVERRPASIQQHPLNMKSYLSIVLHIFRPRLMIIKAVPITNQIYVAEMSQS